MDSERPVRKRQRVTPRDSDDDEGRKQRGRPRVDGQDETAADVRIQDIETIIQLKLMFMVAPSYTNPPCSKSV
jgi:hypothetical protein